MHWGILALSLVASAILALGFIKTALWLGLKDQLNVIVPLLPIFYACIFPILERTMSNSSPAPSSKRPPPRYFDFKLPHSYKLWSGKLSVILTAAGASLLTYMAIDVGAWAVRRRYVQYQPVTLSGLSMSHIGRLIHGNLVPLQGAWKLSYLSLEMLIISFAGGLCAGLLSNTNPLMNGLLAGVIVSIWTGANQFAYLYENLSTLSTRVGAALGVHHSIWTNGLVLGLFTQVFLFALWSGLAYRYKLSKSAVTILMPHSSKRR